MGSGKTEAAINYINSSDDQVHFLYVTPYLSEADRIIKSCPTKKFKQPECYGTKTNGIKYLFEKGVNIVTTHSLFEKFSDEIIDLIKSQRYILILDEAMNVIRQYNDISTNDIKILIENCCNIRDDGIILWNDENYNGLFEKYKPLCDQQRLLYYSNSCIFWICPVSVFKSFHKIFALTYLFKYQLQKYYFDLFHLEYNYLHVKIQNGKFVFSKSNKDLQRNENYKRLIRVNNDRNLNEIGSSKFSLSKQWYKEHSDTELMDRIKKNTIAFFRGHCKTRSKENMWTTYKYYQDKLAGGGYTKGFVPLNMRATNQYKDKIAAAYLVNRYLSPSIKNFFSKNGVTVDEDGYALAEMIQWIWRSAIRDGKEIDLYVPSSRMRSLLNKWLNSI